MKKSFPFLLIGLGFLLLFLFLSKGGEGHAVKYPRLGDGNWYLFNLHQHVWDGREWGSDKVDYKTVFDLMFNGSYFKYDGVLVNDQLPGKEEIVQYRRYVTKKYPEKLYLVGGHYHIRWRGEELSITLIIPSSNIPLLPSEYYECERIINLSFETIAQDVHSVGGLLIWDHPYRTLKAYSKAEIETLMELFDGIELASVRGPNGAGSLTREELDNYWRIIEPYVFTGKIFPVGVTDYSAYLGMPEKRETFWVNEDYGTLVKAYSNDEKAVLQALREKKTIVMLRSEEGELLLYGKPELVEEVKGRLYSGTLR